MSLEDPLIPQNVHDEDGTNNPPVVPGDNNKDENERQKRQEEEIERLLLAQEEEEDNVGVDTLGELNLRQNLDNNNNNIMMNDPNNNNNNNNNNNGDFDEDDNDQHHHHSPYSPPQPRRISYIQASFGAAIALMYYAIRTQQQWYLSLVYLSSSKWAYIILGNAFIASLISIFRAFTRVFLDGLRVAEAEGLGDFFRWNITETCLALTIFRRDLNVKTGILFLNLVLSKCCHWIVDMREGHFRMTEEAIVAGTNPSSWPYLRWTHFKFLLCIVCLQLLDIVAVVHCAAHIVKHGSSVFTLFAFEAAILLISALSNLLLWHLHVLDGLFHYFHETYNPTHFMHRWIHPWKDHKATFVFAVEVQAQAAKFLLYVTFFGIVLTNHGMPINLFREVYMSFQQLKQRLVAFSKYRKLMASMNRFASPQPEELVDPATGNPDTCIICRDEMAVATAKKLPGCGHVFHKSCLREWLVQQQSCPTCRGDIATMEARQRQQEAANERTQQAQAEQEAAAAEAAAEAANTQQQQQQQQEDTVSDNKDSTKAESTPTLITTAKPPPSLSSTKEESSLFESVAKKPSAMVDPESKFHNHHREKRVRIATPPPMHDNASDKSSVFPAFYRVLRDQGAPVWNDGEEVSFVIRVVPFGVILLGQELQWRNCSHYNDGNEDDAVRNDEEWSATADDAAANQSTNRLMLRMPDGWVREDHVHRIHAVVVE